MKLSILLRLVGGCSYNKIAVLLKILVTCGLLEINRYPCANTVQNWVSKIGLFELQDTEGEPSTKEVVLIIDESLRIGREKQLLILSTPYEKEQPRALTFKEVQVVYFGGKTNWNGDLIKAEIDKIREKRGFEIKAILSDEDAKILRASRLSELPHLKDICHAIGTCLRNTFEKDAAYQAFIKELSLYKSKGVNQSLTYLLPPNQRSKARFLNQRPLIDWSEALLNRFDKLSDEEAVFFQSLPNHSSVIASLKHCLDIANEIGRPLKTKGLSKDLLKRIRQQILVLRQSQTFCQAGYLNTFLMHLDRYMVEYEYFISKSEKKNIPVSSEIIESLFGKYKGLVSQNKLVGTTKMNLEIPAQCTIDVDEEYDFTEALEGVFMTDLEDWIEKHSSENQLIMRRYFFKNGT